MTRPDDDDFHVVSIEGYDSNGFFFRNSWGTDWGNNGCGYLPFIGVIEAWVGVSCRDLDSKSPVSRRTLVDSCQFSESCQRISIYGNARRTSVEGSVVPSTKKAELEKERPWYVKLLQCVNGHIIKPK